MQMGEWTRVLEVVVDECELVVRFCRLLILREWGGGVIAGGSGFVAVVVVCVRVIGGIVVGIAFQGRKVVGCELWGVVAAAVVVSVAVQGREGRKVVG